MTKDVLRTCLPTYLCEHLISKKFSRKSFVGAGNQTGIGQCTRKFHNSPLDTGLIWNLRKYCFSVQNILGFSSNIWWSFIRCKRSFFGSFFYFYIRTWTDITKLFEKTNSARKWYSQKIPISSTCPFYIFCHISSIN